MAKAPIITPKEFAQAVDSDARTVRKFMRATTPLDERPGKGNRWAISNTAALRKAFGEWDAARSNDEGDAPEGD